MQVTLIHNPSAGTDERYDAGHLEALIRKAGHEVRFQNKDEKRWAKVLKEPADLVAVAGGDGTVASVAKKLIGRHIPIAPLPLGTANNISKTLRLTDHPIEEIVAGWDLDRRMTFDAGMAKGPWGTRYFIESFGVGLFARSITEADDDKTFETLKSAQEKVEYARQLLRENLDQHSPHKLKMRLDGEDVSGEYALVEMMNMEFIGPNLHLAPDIRPADGLLDVILVRSDEKDQLIETLASQRGTGKPSTRLKRIRARRIELEWKGYQVHFDDKVWPGEDDEVKEKKGTIEIGVVPDALIFLHNGGHAH